MSIVILKLPEVKEEGGRPSRCPVCKGETFQRWGGQVKRVRDPQVKQVMVYRCRCCACRHTFRHYPEGVDQAQQSQRLSKLAALSWMLGLSYRGLLGVFKVFGVSLGRMSAWRDVQERAEQLRKQRKWQEVWVLGLDGAYVRGWGAQHKVLVAVDLGTEQPVTIGYVDEHDPQAVKCWLTPLVKQLGVSVIVTDDLMTSHVISEKLDLDHQVCQFHVRRWVEKSLHALRETLPEEWVGMIDEVKQILQDLAPEGSRQLLELYKKLPARQAQPDQPLSAVDQLRLLLIRLSDHWAQFPVFDWQTDVPWTNNGSERVIGRMKMRSRTVRRYKSKDGMLNALMVTGSGLC
jgi:transposase-like protein